MDQYGGDPSHCRDCMGQKYPPCDLFDESQNDVPLIFLISPMPLHLLIGINFLLAFAIFHISSTQGVGNDALEILEKIYPRVMDSFYAWYKFRRGGTPGNGFTGGIFDFL